MVIIRTVPVAIDPPQGPYPGSEHDGLASPARNGWVSTHGWWFGEAIAFQSAPPAREATGAGVYRLVSASCLPSISAASCAFVQEIAVENVDMQRELRCCAYGGGTAWQAICVDLDIAVQGASFDEVRTSIATAIEIYLETVADMPAEERTAFLCRRSPWHVRVKLSIMAWLQGLFGRQRSHGFIFHPQVSVPA